METTEELLFQLFDMQGRLLQSGVIPSQAKELVIEMQNYTPSTYFVKVYSNEQSIKEFKIIKN